jgi:LemA protein
MWALALLLIVVLIVGYGVFTHQKLNELHRRIQEAYGMMVIPLDLRLACIDQVLKGELRAGFAKIWEARQAVARAQCEKESRLCEEARLTLAIAEAAQAALDGGERLILDRIAVLEGDIALCKEDYNDAVRAFNSKVRSFPAGIVALMRRVSILPLFGESKGALAH